MCNSAGLHQAVNVFKSVLCKCMRYDCSITCTSRTHSCSVIDLPLCALRFLLLQYGGDPFEKQRRDSCSCMTNGRHATEQSASGAPEKNDVTHNMFYNAQQTFDYQYTEQCMRSFSNRVFLQSDLSLADASVLYEFSNSNPEQEFSSCCLCSKKAYSCTAQLHIAN